MIAEGDLVILEHVEEWQFHTGEVILHPFVTVMEVRDGKIVRWHDYSNIGNVIDHAPQWWLERIAPGVRRGWRRRHRPDGAHGHRQPGEDPATSSSTMGTWSASPSTTSATTACSSSRTP